MSDGNETGFAETLACFDFESSPLEDDTMVLACRRVWDDKVPIRLVVHEIDGGFQFLCGGTEHTSVDAIVHVHARHILERGVERLNDFKYLRRGCFAEQLKDDAWTVGKSSA